MNTNPTPDASTKDNINIHANDGKYMKDKTKDQDSLPESTGKKSKRELIERYLLNKYVFRFNELTGGVEWKRQSEEDFIDLNDYQLNSFCRELDKYLGVSIGADILNGYLKSDFTSIYHPVKEYFNHLPKVDGNSAIKELAETVNVKNPELFVDALTKWLVSSIANCYSSNGCQNQTCLVLTGEQGIFKTEWLNNLCPPALIKYLFTGKIDLQSKDTYSLLGFKFIINLDDQLKTLNKRDSETVKTLISHGNITIRKPYDRLFSEHSRLASFCASINGSEFLTDPTGSRRFLPFEVDSLNIKKAKTIDINQVWAEANNIYKSGERYWYTAEETNRLFGGNEIFQLETPEFEMLSEYYRPSEEGDAVQYLTSTQILNQLEAKCNRRLREKQLGEALRRMQFFRTSKKRGGVSIKVYRVSEIPQYSNILDQREFEAEFSKMTD